MKMFFSFKRSRSNVQHNPSNKNDELDPSKRNEKKIDEIISEISECREDERNAQAQIVQVVSTAGTILGVLLGSSMFAKDNQPDIIRVLFYLCVAVFCTAMSFITSIGISNCLRYHYIRDLEDKLTQLLPAESETNVIHWMSFSSPVLTNNIKHLDSKYSKAHYIVYLLSVGLTITVCTGITLFLSSLLEELLFWDYIIFAIFFLIAILTLLCFIIICIDAERMYHFALEKSQKKRAERLNLMKSIHEQQPKPSTKKPSKLQVVKYFVYPKTQDLQKPLLIVVGFIIGQLLYDDIWLVPTSEQILRLIITLVTIEFLIYQARYLWNDIRGVKDDVSADKTNRLPVRILGAARAIDVSLNVIFLRIIATVAILCFISEDLRNFLIAQIFLITVTAILYEYSRTHKKILATFLLVGIGYPLRIAIGIYASYPFLWDSNVNVQQPALSKHLMFVLFLAYFFLGIYSSLLSWVHDAVAQKKNNLLPRKKHYALLLNKLGNRIDQEKPLHERGIVSDQWNIAFWLALVSLTTISIILIHPYNTFFKLFVLALDFFFLICVGIIGLSNFRKSSIVAITSCCLIVLKLIVHVFFVKLSAVNIMICCTQCFFIILYFFLRFLFNPDFDFIEMCITILYKIKCWIIGKDATEYVKESQKTRPE